MINHSYTQKRRHFSTFLLFILVSEYLITLSYGVKYTPDPINPQDYYIGLVADGLDTPTNFVFVPDGRIFVVEKKGTVRVIAPDGTLLPEPWIDLVDEVQNGGDKGLIGITIHPSWPAKKYVYLLYVKDPIYGQPDEPAEMPSYGKLVRYTEGADGKALMNSELILVGKTPAEGLPCCHSSHTVGSVLFGQDGTLLMSSGDGSHWDTPMDDGTNFNQYDAQCEGIFGDAQDVGAFRSQQMISLGGKILRLDPETGEGIGPGNALGAVPNPFWDGNPMSPQSRIYALGFRNEFRVSVRKDNNPAPGTPGTLYVGDVGWQYWEEVNVVTKPGMNFGWPCFQGPFEDADYNNPAVTAKVAQLCAPLIANHPPEAVNPFLAWHHGDPNAGGLNIGYIGNAAAGAEVYTGTNYPDYVGTPDDRAVFYADYGKQWVKVFWVNAQDELNQEKGVFAFMNVGSIAALHPSPVDGDMYFVTTIPGQLRRIRSTNAPDDGPKIGDAPNVFARATPVSGRVPLKVQFSSDDSFDPDEGDRIVMFEWDFGDNTSLSYEPNPVHVYRKPGQYAATLTVTDTHFLRSTYTVHVDSRFSPPSVKITQPAQDYKFENDEIVSFSAVTTDIDTAQDDLEYRWEIRIVHNNHQHPDSFVTTNKTFSARLGTYISPLERNSLEIHLVVTDDTGLTGTTYIRAEPKEAVNTGPKAQFAVTPVVGTAPLTIKCDATACTDAEMDWLYYDWNFGDGLVGSGVSVAHTYAKPGLYTITLTITDPWGAQDTITSDVNVGQPAPSIDLDTDPSLLVHYKMDAIDAAAQTVADASANAAAGKIEGVVLPIDPEGIDGAALLFDGNQVVTAPLAADVIADNLTISAWIKVKPGKDAYMRIVSAKAVWDGPTGFELEYNPGLGFLDLIGSGGNFLRGNFATDGNWHHVVAIANQLTGILIVDGKTIASGLIDRIQPNNPGRDIYIGSNGNVFPNDVAFIGSIDEVRIYSTSIEPLQAIQLHQTFVPPDPTDIHGTNSTSTSAPDNTSTKNNNNNTSDPTLNVPSHGNLETYDDTYGSGATSFYFSVYSLVIIWMVTTLVQLIR